MSFIAEGGGAAGGGERGGFDCVWRPVDNEAALG